jgi:ketol-acid reductoisomerase
MKINIEIECTPEEARSFMGLPDVSTANSVYVDGIARAMKSASNPAQLQEYAEALAPMGQVGLKLFQSFMEGGRRMDSKRSGPGPGSADDGAPEDK